MQIIVPFNVLREGSKTKSCFANNLQQALCSVVIQISFHFPWLIKSAIFSPALARGNTDSAHSLLLVDKVQRLNYSFSYSEIFEL